MAAHSLSVEDSAGDGEDVPAALADRRDRSASTRRELRRGWNGALQKLAALRVAAKGRPAGRGARLLRHTTATLLLGQGVHPRVVMETLGHSQVSLTLDTYSHVLPSLQQEAAKQLDAAIGCHIGCQPNEEASDGDQKVENSSEKVVSLTFPSWNLIAQFLRRIDLLRSAA